MRYEHITHLHTYGESTTAQEIYHLSASVKKINRLKTKIAPSQKSQKCRETGGDIDVL